LALAGVARNIASLNDWHYTAAAPDFNASLRNRPADLQIDRRARDC
jgi:hypothetical protein